MRCLLLRNNNSFFESIAIDCKQEEWSMRCHFQNLNQISYLLKKCKLNKNAKLDRASFIRSRITLRPDRGREQRQLWMRTPEVFRCIRKPNVARCRTSWWGVCSSRAVAIQLECSNGNQLGGHQPHEVIELDLLRITYKCTSRRISSRASPLLVFSSWISVIWNG